VHAALTVRKVCTHSPAVYCWYADMGRVFVKSLEGSHLVLVRSKDSQSQILGHEGKCFCHFEENPAGSTASTFEQLRANSVPSPHFSIVCRFLVSSSALTRPSSCWCVADIFKESLTYLEDEAAYEKVRKELLGEVRRQCHKSWSCSVESVYGALGQCYEGVKRHVSMCNHRQYSTGRLVPACSISPWVSVVILVAWIGASREIDPGILFLSDQMR
jgi:hypothetical protein